MFSLNKKVFIVLLVFGQSSLPDPTKCLSLIDESCMVTLTLVDLNPLEYRYYPFMISVCKCSRNCNFLSPKICVPKETE